MNEVKTWADFAALSEEDRSALSSEDLEALKTSVAENEAKLAEDRKKSDEDGAKAKELAENYRIRAEKAEKEAKGRKETEQKPETLTPKDILALNREGITEEEDVDEIINFAGYRKVSVSEAMKDKTLKSILADKAEERKTALATQTKGGQPAGAVSGATLLERASKGELPERDEDIERLARARLESRMSRKK